MIPGELWGGAWDQRRVHFCAHMAQTSAHITPPHLWWADPGDKACVWGAGSSWALWSPFPVRWCGQLLLAVVGCSLLFGPESQLGQSFQRLIQGTVPILCSWTGRSGCRVPISQPLSRVLCSRSAPSQPSSGNDAVLGQKGKHCHCPVAGQTSS